MDAWVDKSRIMFHQPKGSELWRDKSQASKGGRCEFLSSHSQAHCVLHIDKPRAWRLGSGEVEEERASNSPPPTPENTVTVALS